MKNFKKLIAVFAAVIMALSIAVFAGCNNANKDDASKFAKHDFAAAEVIGKQIDGDGELLYELKCKINFDGNADMIFTPYERYERYEYIFLRDWKCYLAMSNDGDTNDFTTEDLAGAIDIKAFLEKYYDIKNAKSDVNSLLYSFNSAIMCFGEDFKAFTEENGKITVDLSKAIYNAVEELKIFINGLKEETTVGDVLKNDTVKKIVSKLTNIISPEQLIDTVKKVISAMGEESIGEKLDGLLGYVKPDKNSTTYDYLIKLVNSQETVDFINGIIGNGVGITKKLADFTLGELLKLLDTQTTLEEIKVEVLDFLSSFATKDGFQIDSDYCLDTKIEYSFDDKHNLTSQKIVGRLYYLESNNELRAIYSVEINYKDKAFPASEFKTLPAQLPEIENY